MKSDFSKGAVWKCILRQAVPLTVAQVIQLLYNIVDRIYIGHMGEGDSIALTGVGLTFPVITIIMAFTALFGVGGVPLFSIARGAGDEEKAKKILGNSAALLLISSLIITFICYVFKKPLLYAFGASEDSFVYADNYLKVYLSGTVFSMLTTGLNGYISAQGFPGIGMLSVVIGATLNIILDPIFIFCLGMEVEGVALATVISQMISAIWVLSFLCGKKAIIPIRREYIKIETEIAGEISRLGTSNFIMQGTAFAVQVACNTTLQNFGGDIYVGIMTVLNSIRDIFVLPLFGIVNGSQMVIGYNYGARLFDRVKAGVRFNTAAGFICSALAWVLVLAFPGRFLGLFTDDLSMIKTGINAMHIYFFGFVFMAFQFAGQTTFQALGDAKHAVIFSLLRKVIIVVPLTLILPYAGFGVNGVFLAEPVSNIIGGAACYITMKMTVYKRLGEN